MEFQIYIKEENSKLPVSPEKLRLITQSVFSMTNSRKRDVSLVVCNDKFITTLNKKYRNRDFPTDVLSFSMDEGKGHHFESPILGDIIISIDTAQTQAEMLHTTLQEEFFILYIHGLLHLLGYTHDSKEEENKMMSMTSKILSEVM